MGAKLKIRNTISVGRIKNVSAEAFKSGQLKAAIQMLDWMSSGSMGSQAAPPIRTGVLASSGSAFYKKQNIGVSPDIAGGKGTPNKSFNSRNITWGFDTDYAKKLHEEKLNPGPLSKRNPNRQPGNQWLTEHLQKDKDNYMKLVAKFAKKFL